MLHDAIVVGGSFAGLSAAMQFGRARRTVLVIDAGRSRNRFSPASHGFFGQDGVSPAVMIADARRQVAAYPSVSFLEGEVVRASHEDAAFAVTLGDGTVAHSSTLVLAFGVQDMLPDLPGLRERWGRTVLHCPYCHGYELDRAPLGVLALGPMSAHQALLLADWGPVTLFTDGRDDLDGEMHANLARRSVAIETVRVVSLEGDAPALEGVRLADGRLAPVAAPMPQAGQGLGVPEPTRARVPTPRIHSPHAAKARPPKDMISYQRPYRMTLGMSRRLARRRLPTRRATPAAASDGRVIEYGRWYQTDNESTTATMPDRAGP